MSIEHRSKNTWRVGIKVLAPSGTWEWIRETVKMPEGMSEAKQRKEAEKVLRRIQTEVDEGRRGPADAERTVADLARLWMHRHVDPNCSPVTAKTYRNFLDARIIPQLGDVKLSKLTPMMCMEWLDGLRTSKRLPTYKQDQLKDACGKEPDNAILDKPLSDKTIRHYYTTLHSMLDKAVQWELISRNPMDKVDRPKVKRPKLRTLTEEEAIDLVRKLDDEQPCYRIAVLLALLCGLRLGEIGALQFSDVDFDHNCIDVTRALKYTSATGAYEDDPKTEAGIRLISLPSGLMDMLKEEQAYQKEMRETFGDSWIDSGYILHGWNGAQLNHDTISKWFRRFADKNGYEGVRFHDLRHTHATLLLAANLDPVAVAHRLGHSDASTTLRVYAHALRRRDEQAALAIQSLLDQAHPASPDPALPDESDEN